MEELKQQTDRGAGIIAAAILEEMLEVVLLARLGHLNRKHYEAIFAPEGALGSFSKKIEIGFALGIYSEEGCRNLHTIREIRNKFAHRIEALVFDHPDIAAVVDRDWSDEFGNTRRARFINAFRIMGMLLLTPRNADIRVKSVGETHAGLYVGLIEILDPEIAEKAAKVILRARPREAPK